MSDTELGPRRIVAMASLPLDLLARARGEAGEPRTHRDSAFRGFPMWLGGLSLLVLAFSLATSIVAEPALAFHDLVRWAPLVLGATLFGVWMAWPRPFAGQRLLVGATSLVIVDEHSVEVLPAERLTLSDEGISCDGELVDLGAHAPGWRALVAAAITRAGEPAERRADRWRIGAQAGMVTSPERERASRRVVALLAGGIGLFLAVFLEAGPLHARAEGLVDRRGDWARVTAVAQDLDARLGQWAANAGAWTQQQQAKIDDERRREDDKQKELLALERRRAEERREHERRELDVLVKKDDPDGYRAFLEKTRDPELAERAQELLTARCTRAVPDGQYATGVLRATAILLRRVCAEVAPTLYYAREPLTNADEARMEAEGFAEGLSKASIDLKMPMSVSAVFAEQRAMVRIGVTPRGPRRASKRPGAMAEQECRVKATVLDDAGLPVPGAAFEVDEVLVWGAAR